MRVKSQRTKFTKLSPNDDAMIAVAYADEHQCGRSLRRTARAFGVSIETVRQSLKRSGATIAPRDQHPALGCVMDATAGTHKSFYRGKVWWIRGVCKYCGKKIEFEAVRK